MEEKQLILTPFPSKEVWHQVALWVNPNVANLRRGKTHESASDVAAHRLEQVEAYLTVREALFEASTVADGVLSRERSGFYRCRFATLGFIRILAHCGMGRVGQKEGAMVDLDHRGKLLNLINLPSKVRML